jgi:hypothetical protein
MPGGPLWLKNVVLTHSRSLPVFSRKQACQAATDMSQKCQPISQLGGKARFDWLLEGLVCEIVLQA